MDAITHAQIAVRLHVNTLVITHAAIRIKQDAALALTPAMAHAWQVAMDPALPRQKAKIRKHLIYKQLYNKIRTHTLY